MKALRVEQTRKIGINAARVLLGVCFVFSGFVKAIDPLGSSYKFTDYFNAFGLGFLTDLTWLMAVGLSTLEFFLGTALLLGFWKKSITMLSLLFMVFMTSLTLYSALKNPVTDCGCFGDALILTNWQTFYKNLVLLALAIPVFLWHDLFFGLLGTRTGRLSAYWCLLFPLLLSYYSSQHLPLIDFRPYRIGNKLADLMTVPKGAPIDSFEIRFRYEKQGVKQEFTVENAPVSDPTWRYVDRTVKQVRKGYTPPIHDFMVEHPTRGDITDEILNDTSYTFLLVTPRLEESKRSAAPNIQSIDRYAQKQGYAFYGLTSSDLEAMDEWNYEYDSQVQFCVVDDRVLKTIVRSNPGLLLLKNGVVLQKWSGEDIPDFSTEKRALNQTPWGEVREVSTRKTMGKVFVFFMIPIFLLFAFHKGLRLHFNFQKKKNLTTK